MAMKVAICYESKYGNTQLLAETIGEEMRRTGAMEVSVAHLKRVAPETLANADLILVGGPTHFGGPTRRITKFIDDLARQNLRGKSVAVFDTYLSTDFEKSVKRMEEQIRTVSPTLKIAAPGLSIRVADMKGPIVDGELVKCKDFVRQLTPQPALV